MHAYSSLRLGAVRNRRSLLLAIFVVGVIALVLLDWDGRCVGLLPLGKQFLALASALKIGGAGNLSLATLFGLAL